MTQFDNAREYYKKLILGELPEGVCVAGGSVRNFFSGENPKKSDVDLFFDSERTRVVSFEHLKEKDAKIIYDNDRVTRVNYKRVNYDLVKEYYMQPQELINEFDFTVSMFAVTKDRVYHGETSFIDLAKRQIMFNPLCKFRHPLSVLTRVIKYVGKGFYICKGEQRKLYETIRRSGIPAHEQIIGNYDFIIGFD